VTTEPHAIIAARHGRRRLVGIAGCPGSGKSTLAAALAAQHPATSVIVPMDGFHLAAPELRRLGRDHRKGAPDTFDVDGYVALLERIRSTLDTVVRAPSFDRTIEETVPDAITVHPWHSTVITEGNYLLHDRDGWERVRPLLDECWYVDVDHDVRIARLIARHIDHGRTATAATAWVRTVDEPNARLVERTRHHADRIVGDDGALR
jgi:pantothenate kinase